ncbi:TonB-dependent outer membrane receptor VreA, partial [Pseudomonas aeruginosa]
MSILGVARSCAVSLLGLGMLLPASGAVPGDGGRPPLRLAVHAFDIPPQSLASALVTYSGVTGMAVLVDGELARGRRSARLQGRFTASDALTRLLGGTGLMARYTSQEEST